MSSTLPRDVLGYMLSFLHRKPRLRVAALVCRAWHSASKIPLSGTVAATWGTSYSFAQYVHSYSPESSLDVELQRLTATLHTLEVDVTHVIAWDSDTHFVQMPDLFLPNLTSLSIRFDSSFEVRWPSLPLAGGDHWGSGLPFVARHQTQLRCLTLKPSKGDPTWDEEKFAALHCPLVTSLSLLNFCPSSVVLNAAFPKLQTVQLLSHLNGRLAPPLDSTQLTSLCVDPTLLEKIRELPISGHRLVALCSNLTTLALLPNDPLPIHLTASLRSLNLEIFHSAHVESLSQFTALTELSFYLRYMYSPERCSIYPFYLSILNGSPCLRIMAVPVEIKNREEETKRFVQALERSQVEHLYARHEDRCLFPKSEWITIHSSNADLARSRENARWLE